MKLVFENLNKKTIVYIFLVVTLILLGSLYFQNHKMKEEMKIKVQFIEQKNMLRDELDDIIDVHDDLLDEYGELNEQLHEKDSLIQTQITEIKKLLRTKKDLKEAKLKIENLKSIAKKYIANIDSLLILNEQLSMEKDSVISVNKDINWRNYKLNKENKELTEAVNKGSALSLADIIVEAIKYKSTGKEVSTKYAKKTQKIRVCFSVLANPIAKAESRIAYMQMINENGQVVLGSNDINTIILDTLQQCTDSTSFNYNNIQLTHCFEWERVNKLESGYYLINLIMEEKILLQTTMKLK